MARRPSKNRRSTQSIMSNTGFGDLSITKGGMRITIPVAHLTATGAIKNRFIKNALQGELNLENITRLHSIFGVVFEKLA